MTSGLRARAIATEAAATLRNRLSPLVTMVAAATLVALTVCAAGITVWKMHEQADREVRTNLGKLALVIADQTSRSFQSVDMVLAEAVDYLATNGTDTTDSFRNAMSGEAAHQLLANRARNLSQVGNLILIGADGWLLSQSRNTPIPRLSILNREHFRHLRDNDDAALFVSEPVRNVVDGVWMIYLARRVNSRQGAFLGIIEAAIPLKHFETFYRTIALGEGSAITLLRRDGMLLARYPAVESMIGRSLGSQAFSLIDKYTDRGSALGVGLIDGVSRYIAYSSVRGFPLVVATSLSEEVALGAWRRDAMVLLMGAVGALTGVIVLLFSLARQIRRMRRSENLLALQNLELERSSYQLLEAQRIGKLGHWVSDATGTAIWSPQLFEIAGLAERPNVPFETSASLVHPEDIDLYQRVRNDARARGAKMDVELRWIRPDGGIRWVRMKADPRFDSGGKRLGMFGIVHDITSSKLAEAILDQRVADLELVRNQLEAQKRELAEVNMQFAAALSNMSQGLCLFDVDKKLIISNARFREIYGLTEQQSRQGTSFGQILQHNFDLGDKLDHPIDEGTAVDAARARYTFRLHDGRIISIRRATTPDGGWLSTHEDVTERERAATVLADRLAELEAVRNRLETQKRELAEVNMQFGAALSNMSQGLCLFDADRNLVISNRRFREIYNLTEDQTRPGLSLANLLRFHEANGEKTDRTLDQEVEEIPTQRNQVFSLSDGRTIMIQRTPIPAGGWVATHEDITERERAATVLGQRLAELELARSRLEAQKQELIATTQALGVAKNAAEAASLAKSDFLAMMSHEIRTPMTGMMGMIDLLRETALDQEQQGYAVLAERSAQSLLDVVNDILDFSKLEAGKMLPESIDFDVGPLIEDAASLLQKKAQDQGLDLRVSLSPELPKWLKGDPSRIRQVLLNLISNAVKFTERGSVEIGVSHQDLPDGTIELRIEVADSGSWIRPDVQKRLFNPFVQADTSISRRYGGSGLGLAICKQLCAIMDGAIGLDSEQDKGNKFWFTVRCKPGNPVVAAPALLEMTVRPLQILIAEDSPIVATLISKLLVKQGFRADMVVNGLEAVAAVRHKSYDLVLMDVHMPEMDGKSATRAIRNLVGPEREVPIIALTANALPGQRERYLAAGMNDCVTKPIQPLVLFAAINRWAAKDAVVSPSLQPGHRGLEEHLTVK
jgi:PAS domain S-box-containing protein